MANGDARSFDVLRVDHTRKRSIIVCRLRGRVVLTVLFCLTFITIIIIIIIIIIIMYYYYYYWLLLSTLEQTHCAHVPCDSEWVTVASLFLISTQVVTVLICCCMAGATWNCYRLGASSAYTIQPCTSLHCHFIRIHICRLHVYWTVTCPLHFWQNDQYFLRATAVTRGWNGYRNKSAQKVHPGKRQEIFIPPLLAGIGTRDLSITSPAL